MGLPELIAFDCFGTLVRNESTEWATTLAAIAEEQQLRTDTSLFYSTWSQFEVSFRKTRTNMDDPKSSPPFRTYWEAWRDAFRDTFEALGVHGDAEAAATRCIDDLCLRESFDDTDEALRALDGRMRLAVMSNADDRFLLGTIAHNGWTFDTIVSSEQARAYKPDRRAFWAVCEASGVPPERVLYVGDSVYDDAHGAKLAGMRAVLVIRDQLTPGRTPPPAEAELLAADHQIMSLTDMAHVLDLLD
jgi:2-haloalkanoic acid dehalogenase type II